jgi:hypothetical protein
MRTMQPRAANGEVSMGGVNDNGRRANACHQEEPKVARTTHGSKVE